ncbi:MAG: helix-turn-helix domain-containing protein [Oscillospiraceae bacterium]|nr:helix-turn-helix domain-containing protein [Oscillospiraceae bacterium]
MFKEYRIKKGYTQEKVAEALGISTRHYQRLEEEPKRLPSFELFKKIVKVLEIEDKDIVKYIKNK